MHEAHPARQRSESFQTVQDRLVQMLNEGCSMQLGPPLSDSRCDEPELAPVVIDFRPS